MHSIACVYERKWVSRRVCLCACVYFDTCCLNATGTILSPRSRLSLILLVLREKARHSAYLSVLMHLCCSFLSRSEFNNTAAHIWSARCQACAALLDRGNEPPLNLRLTRNCSFHTNNDHCHRLPLQPTSFPPFAHHWRPPFICSHPPHPQCIYKSWNEQSNYYQPC